MNAYPSGLVRLTGHHAFDNFAINLGTNLYGMKRCVKTLNLILGALANNFCMPHSGKHLGHARGSDVRKGEAVSRHRRPT